MDRKSPTAQEGSQVKAIEELQGQMQVLMRDMEWVKANMRVILQKLEETADEVPPDNYDMAASQIKDLILEKIGLDKPFYPGDLAMEHGLDFDEVLKAVDILRKEGRIVDRD